MKPLYDLQLSNPQKQRTTILNENMVFCNKMQMKRILENPEKKEEMNRNKIFNWKLTRTKTWINAETLNTFPDWINWGTILNTVEEGIANPTPADVPVVPKKNQ